MNAEEKVRHARRLTAEQPREPGSPVPWVAPEPRTHRKRNVAVAVVLSLLAVGWIGSLGSDDAAPRVVTAHIDLQGTAGKTVRVAAVTSTGLIQLKDAAGRTTTVELAHVVLPERTDCLGSEALAQLQALLPVGAAVAGWETGEVTVDGTLVAAELARAGLAVATPGGATADPQYRAIASAQKEARASQAGLYSTAVACTLPAQLAALAAATASVSGEADAVIALAVLDQARVGGLNTLVEDARRTQQQLAAVLAGNRRELPLAALTDTELDAARTQVADAESLLTTTVTRTNERIAAENARIEAEAAAAAAAEAQRLADEQARAAAAAAPPESSSLEPWNMPGPDLDCSDIRQKVRITGPDYHRLDRDGDGWGCESYG